MQAHFEVWVHTVIQIL